ncbi:MAG: glycoside hydrolase family 2 TIM barrel-domain containing protein [bacterium]|nr:glycoside hydrolase family 2 TIM barrel-domain containing protein [bacterium]
MRSIIPFNDGWLFHPAEVGTDTPDTAFAPVTLPHTTRLLPHHNFDVDEYAFVSTYRKRFTLPEPGAGRRVYLDFDGAMIASTVSINGHTFDEFRGGYVPFSFDITDYLNEDGENLLTVRLDSTERKDIPPFGYVVDYLAFGGIYRDVSLRYVEPYHIDNLFVITQNVLTPSAQVHIAIRFNNQTDDFQQFPMQVRLIDPDGNIVVTQNVIQALAAQRIYTTVVTLEVEEPRLWSLNNPELYRIVVDLHPQNEENNPVVDTLTDQFGFREARFDKDGSFYLNGERLKLIGLNRHQTYPYIGAAAPARLQAKDADIIKDELGCNIVRTSHYPQSPHFLNRCDEIGLLVFEEIPGWQFIGDDDWKKLALRDVRAMIERDRNHPSIVLWGVRINESWDDEAFYDDTNTLARELDPTRQTGGVRNFLGSQFIEDVYTYNDFSNTVLDPEHTPHLVTEFNGHMYPTKVWDQEERLIEHALRHARIQDKQLGMPNVAGAIGWCAFDYNTHKELGSGDRICYHGVSDIFRLPKFAAYFYSSQSDPAQRIVLEAATYWTMGDRSEGGNDPLVVFSNCDEIAVYIGDGLHGRYQPDRAQFPNLPHPPFTVTGLGLLMTWGSAFGDLRIVGLLNGEQIIERQYASDGKPAALTLQTDDAELKADGADMTRVVFKIVDRYGNRLPYTQSVVMFELDGPGELIGENPFPLMGGQAALYVKATHTPGVMTVRASTPRLPSAQVEIVVK